MGKSMSTIRPESPEETQQELDQVLEASKSVLIWSNGIITNERYEMLNDVLVIANKVEDWINTERPMLELAMEEVEAVIQDIYKEELLVIAREIEDTLRSDYSTAYGELRQFMQSAKKISKEQRKIHKDLLKLNDLLPNDVVRCSQELARLRVEVFKNVRKVEKKETEYRRLHEKFDYKVSQIDQKVEDKCKKRVEELKIDIMLGNLPRSVANGNGR